MILDSGTNIAAGEGINFSDGFYPTLILSLFHSMIRVLINPKVISKEFLPKKDEMNSNCPNICFKPAQQSSLDIIWDDPCSGNLPGKKRRRNNELIKMFKLMKTIFVLYKSSWSQILKTST